jgi:hypothetical protein
MDPVLRIYTGCRVMLPSNIDVKGGQANGTQAIVEGIAMKPGEIAQHLKLKFGGTVNAVKASQVDYILLRHLNDRISPALFSVKAKEYTFRAKMPKPQLLRTKTMEKEIIQMKALQFPVLVNNATTGHKLQGSGVNKLFVHSWSYVTNWVYVMLSRVKTLQGLYLRLPLSFDLTKYAMSERLRQMMHELKTNHSPTYWTDEEYDELFPTLTH